MEQEYLKPSAPYYQQPQQQSDLIQHQMEISPPDLATSNQVDSLKKWIIASIVSNIAAFFGIVGFLIFIYYTLLIEIEDG